MAEYKATTPDGDVLLIALEDIQERLAEHTTALQHLEARPIVELAGLERRIDELADAVARMRPALPPPRRWWLTPAWVTLAFVLGVCSTYGALVWTAQRQQAVVQKPPVSAPVAPGKRGK